ncbi:integrase catalytic domain-containing protein [Nephila pilipes]|uniref:Integrase catalytic domain-containing protein n=1 Tax=Nephila pilipes TaxID=299642 RepID=A0A8X6QPT6_NEPPI|nr:integrase catalytic domain-containing protein [Nephila pilipes]
MQDYIDKKQVEIVSHEAHNKERLFYLPHHTVKKTAYEETKSHIVFFASSHSPCHQSLSDALEIGPNLLLDIMATLLRFGLSKIAITCDRSQAFLQLILSDKTETHHDFSGTTYTPDGKLRRLNCTLPIHASSLRTRFESIFIINFSL